RRIPGCDRHSYGNRTRAHPARGALELVAGWLAKQAFNLLMFDYRVSGSVNNLPTAVGFFDYEPDTVTAYDVGSKNRFLDDRFGG
ncbi:MAG TPA: hypothetical protein VGH38_27695, partial [Bryobacteraceae bacterium]